MTGYAPDYWKTEERYLAGRSPVNRVHLCSYPNTSRDNGVESSHVSNPKYHLEIASCGRILCCYDSENRRVSSRTSTSVVLELINRNYLKWLIPTLYK